MLVDPTPQSQRLCWDNSEALAIAMTVSGSMIGNSHSEKIVLEFTNRGICHIFMKPVIFSLFFASFVGCSVFGIEGFRLSICRVPWSIDG